MSDTSPQPPRSPLTQAILAVVRAVVTVAVLLYRVLEAIFTPIVRPIWRWMAGVRVFQAIGAWIGRQQPYVVLVLLGVPFVVIEPAKYVAVIWGVIGHPVEGTIALIVTEILSLLVCERIFHAGYEPLMRIGWLRRLLAWTFGLRDRAIAWARDTAVWRAATETWQRLRRMFAR